MAYCQGTGGVQPSADTALVVNGIVGTRTEDARSCARESGTLFPMSHINEGPIQASATAFCVECQKIALLFPRDGWIVKDGRHVVGLLHERCRESWEAKNPNSGLTLERGT